MSSRKLGWVVFAAIIGITIWLSTAVFTAECGMPVAAPKYEGSEEWKWKNDKGRERVNRANITAAAGANGSISPAGVTAVLFGASQTYTITPNAGFTVSALSVDGVVLPGATTHTFTNVTAAHYINAYFAPVASVTITATAAANGSISPAGVTAVLFGASQTYTITPNAGFTVSALSVDGVVLPGAPTHTFTNVTANHYIHAYFK